MSFGNGYFRAGFSGWFRSALGVKPESHPGKFTLSMSSPSASMIYSTANIGISSATPGFTLERYF